MDYSFIKDIKDPSNKELKVLQRKLKNNRRRDSLRYFLKEYTDNCCNINIIDPKGLLLEKKERFFINSNETDFENLIISYASFNKNYPRGLKRLTNLIKESDFRGHLITRLGGWPNLKNNSLVFAHVPYAFKTCFFDEVIQMGYKKILWIDTSVVPLKGLAKVFEQLEENSYFVLGNHHNIGPYLNDYCLSEYGISMDQAMSIPSCEVSVFGFDLSSNLGKSLFLEWRACMQKKYGYFSARPEQNALSLVLHKNNISNFVPLSEIATSWNNVNPSTRFLVDRSYVH